MDEIKAYCMKCKAERVVSNVQIVTMKNGRPAANGQCPVCGTKMFKFLPKSTVMPAAAPAVVAEVVADPVVETAPAVVAEVVADPVVETAPAPETNSGSPAE